MTGTSTSNGAAAAICFLILDMFAPWMRFDRSISQEEWCLPEFMREGPHMPAPCL